MAQQPSPLGIGQEVSPDDLLPVGAEVSEADFAPSKNPQRAQPPHPAAGFEEFGWNFLKESPMAVLGLLPQMATIAKDEFKKAREHAAQGNYGRATAYLLDALHVAPVGTAAEMAKGATAASWDQVQKAVAAAQGGHGAAAIGHLAGAFPMLGPHAAEAIEKYTAGEQGLGGTAGTLVGMGASMYAPHGGKFSLPETVMSPKLVRPTRNPVLAGDIAWAEGRGFQNMDLGTATGSQFIRGAQRLTNKSLFGRMAEPDIMAQQQELGGLGRTLANETVTPGVAATPTVPGTRLRIGKPKTPYEAGGAVQASVLAKEKQLGREASREYRTVESIELDPYMRETVQRTPEEVQQALATRRNNMTRTLGDTPVPNADELEQLLKIREELDANQFSQGKLVRDSLDTSDTHYVPRSGNADVYKDITQAAPGSSQLSGEYMRDSISKALETGEFNYASMGALQVARDRLTAGRGGMGPNVEHLLPKVATTYDVQMPVNLESARRKMMPLYKRLEQQLPFARQPIKDAYNALNQIMSGPNHVPFGQVEGALSALKKITRGGKEVAEEGTKTASQGIAGMEVRALEDALDGALQAAKQEPMRGQMFEDAVAALHRGRGKTAEKYEVKSLRKRVTRGDASEETVFRWLTQPGDAGAKLLGKVRDVAPKSVATTARAYIDQLINIAEEKGYKAANKIWTDTGPRTKGMLFTPEHAENMTRYLRLAEKMSENVNISGTSYGNMQAGQLYGLMAAPGAALKIGFGFGAVAKLLHSPRGAKMLMQGVGIPVRNTAAVAAWTRQLGHYIDEADQEDEQP